MKSTTSQRLAEIMKERNLRQVDILRKSEPFQKKLGVKMGKSALSQYLSGKSVPDQDKLVLLAQTLDVNEAWLMGFDAPKYSESQKNENISHSFDLSNLRNEVVLFDGKPLSDEDVDRIAKIIELSLEVEGNEDRWFTKFIQY